MAGQKKSICAVLSAYAFAIAIAEDIEKEAN
jgi:hypothetical protein